MTQFSIRVLSWPERYLLLSHLAAPQILLQIDRGHR
jgi:hypothetical protein